MHRQLSTTLTLAQDGTFSASSRVQAHVFLSASVVSADRFTAHCNTVSYRTVNTACTNVVSA